MMDERREVRQYEAETREYIWGDQARPTRFAIRRVRSGLTFGGVRQILNKPHGLHSVMVDVLSLVVAKGMKRWTAILKHLLPLHPQPRTYEALDILVAASVLVVRERNTRPNKGEFWEVQEVVVDLRAEPELNQIYPPKPTKDDSSASLLSEAKAIIAKWQWSEDPVCGHLDRLVQDGIGRLRGEPDGLFDIPVASRVRYRSVLLTLIHARLLAGNRESLPIRTLSTQLWDNSKVLERYKEDIIRLAGVPLGRIGITSHPDLLWAYGAVTLHLEGGHWLNLLSGRPTVLAEETVMVGRVAVSDAVKAILVVENLTVFLEVLSRRYYERTDVLVMLSGGYMGPVHTRLLRGIISQKPVPIYVWSDMDGDGMAIAHQVCSLAKRLGVDGLPILMDGETWARGSGRRPAGERDLALSANPEMQLRFPELSRLIEGERRTLEQEALLSDWAFVEGLLP